MHIDNSPLRLRRSSRFVAACMFLCVPLASQSADYTWNLSDGGNWNFTDLNWNNGAADVAWSNGNTAVFNGFAVMTDINLQSNLVLEALKLNSINGTRTLRLQGGSGNSTIDVGTITITGGSSIDMYAAITGNHGLSLTSDDVNGRLNVKVANTYTGDTYLYNKAYLLSDVTSNALPTGTTVHMENGTYLRFASGISQEIAGLDGRGTVEGNDSGAGVLTIRTKAGVSTDFNGTMRRTAFSVVITGSGSQTLRGVLSYGGKTQVSGGTLILRANLTGSSQVIVDGGDLQSGVSNINLGVGDVLMSAGSISPNDVGTAGTMTVAADRNFTTTGGVLNMDVGTQSDQILGSGTGVFDLSGTVIALTMGDGFSYEDSYTLLSGFSSGSIVNIGVTGYDTANWQAILDVFSGDLVLSFNAVPEPSTYALLLGALVMGAVAAFRRFGALGPQKRSCALRHA